MDITYDNVLAMPNNFIVVENNEMEYVNGGASAVVYGTTGAIRKRLNLVISSCVLGNLLATGGGGVIGSLGGIGCVFIGAAAGAFIGDAWYGTIKGYASSAHNKVEGFIRKYGTGKGCTMISTWSNIFCTGIDVILGRLHSGGGRSF